MNKKVTHTLKRPFTDHRTWAIGTPVCVEPTRVSMLTGTGEVGVGGVMSGWADIFDISNFQPTDEWFEPVGEGRCPTRPPTQA